MYDRQAMHHMLPSRAQIQVSNVQPCEETDLDKEFLESEECGSIHRLLLWGRVLSKTDNERAYLKLVSSQSDA